MKSVWDLFERCNAMLGKIGLDIEPYYLNDVRESKRMTSTFGICKSRRSFNGCWFSTITISSRVLQDNVPDKSAESVMIHEILHARHPDDHHGGMWKLEAEIVSRKLGYDIVRSSTSDSLGIKDDGKYTICCSKCGYKWTRNRMCGLVEHPWKYTHSGCGGKLQRVA